MHVFTVESGLDEDKILLSMSKTEFNKLKSDTELKDKIGFCRYFSRYAMHQTVVLQPTPENWFDLESDPDTKD